MQGEEFIGKEGWEGAPNHFPPGKIFRFSMKILIETALGSVLLYE
jgi:hypothetical protein